EKARLLETSQKALQELQRLYGEEAALAWKQKLTGDEITYQYSSTGFTKMLQDSHQTVDAAGNQLNKEIKYRGQVIGSLDFIRDDLEGRWTEEEEVLIEEILEQTALALENARLVDQIKLRSDQINLLQQITAIAASTLDQNELLAEVSNKLQSSLQLDQCGVVLFDNLNQSARLATSAPEIMKPAGTPEIPLDEDPLRQQEVQDSADIVLIHDLQGSSKYKTFTHSFNVEISNSLILLPITFRDEAVGYIFMAEQDEDRKLDMEENNLFNQIQAQISTAVESARLFAAEQQGREASAALLEITQISSASLDINEVLNEATYRSAEAIQANRCTILLLDEREKIKPLISVYNDGTQMEDDEWDKLVMQIRATYQNVPLRTLAASLRTPRYIDSPLTYEQFPMGWTHHFGIEKILMVPLISQNKVIGSMVYDLTSREKSFTQSQVELAQTIAGQIATTLENANLFDQAIRRAERERQVTEITAKIRSSNDPKEILDTAISELRLALAKQELQEKQKATATKRKTSKSNGKDDL
ncbi:MAG TPA: GAF domain-containing protein, partial [Anaerolineales bacterium]|nr:GAF domain-containing protein [Anaerolineales bacterium]